MDNSGRFKSGGIPWNKGSVGLMPVPWNKGRGELYTEEFRKAASSRMKGKVLSEETKMKMSLARKGKSTHIPDENARRKMSLAQRGKILSEQTRSRISDSVSKRFREGSFPVAAEYRGVRMRSVEEIQFAQWLDLQGIEWEYQPIIFKTPKGLNYIPDFRIVKTNEFVEVKKRLLELSNPVQAYKMTSFVEAGFELLVAIAPFTSAILNKETTWLTVNRIVTGE